MQFNNHAEHFWLQYCYTKQSIDYSLREIMLHTCTIYYNQELKQKAVTLPPTDTTLPATADIKISNAK